MFISQINLLYIYIIHFREKNVKLHKLFDIANKSFIHIYNSCHEEKNQGGDT